jgi:O-antigen/teichoic acid export membrane protein
MGPKLYIEVIRKNFKFTLGTTLISILNIIHTQADKIFISKLLPVSDLGYYSVAYTGVSKGTLLTNAVSEATYPSFSSLAKSDNRDLLMHQYHRLQDFICFIILPVFAAVPFAIVPLFSFIFNPEVAYSLLLPMTFVSVGFYMNGTTMIPYIFSLAVDRPDITVKMNFYALFIILPIAATFVYFFGILGAGFSWLCYNVFLYIYSMPRICKECLRIKTSVWYKHVLRILFSGLFIYGISWLMLVFIKNYSILVLSIVYIISSVAFLFSAYFLISKQLRETIIYYLKLILKPEAYGQ